MFCQQPLGGIPAKLRFETQSANVWLVERAN